MARPRKAPLRVVQDADKPAAPRPRNLKAAVALSERELLVACRERVASEIDSGPPAHALPRLMSQLRELDKDIRLIDAKAAAAEDSDSLADEPWDPSAL